MEPEWEKFLFLVCEDQESISSPAYQLIIEHFPVQFVRKLMATIQHGSTWETRHQATMLLDYLFHDIVEENYATMERGCIEEMERSAMNLLMVEDDAYVLDKVKGVVKTLLGLSIDHNRVWKDFIKVAGKSFIARQASRLKELTVDIFLDLSIDHQDYVCRELVPDFLHLHTKKLVEKFADSEEDQTAFSILWVVCNMVPIDQLEVLMEAATKAPLFWGGKRVSAAKKVIFFTVLGPQYLKPFP